MKEHEWFIEPCCKIKRKSFPLDHLNLKVISEKKASTIKFDVQIICLHTTRLHIEKILNTFHIPIVWIEYWKTSYKPKLSSGIYPMISTSRTSSRRYQDLRYIYPSSDPNLWNKPWIGDEKKVFIPFRRSLTHEAKRIVLLLEQEKIPMTLLVKGKRNIPFKEWKEYFIHSRVLLEITPKHSSTILIEAMSIGMPVVTSDIWDYKYIIRNKEDGFYIKPSRAVYILSKFLDDYSFAKEMGRRAKKRADEVFNIQEFREQWNKAFKDAIEVFETIGDWI